MTQKHRTRAHRRVKVKTPGGKLTIHYRRRKPKKAHCSQCNAELKGVPRDLPYKIRKLPKSKRRPERPFGGRLCSECMRKAIKQKFNISKQTALNIGQLCVKLAGREAGKICVIVDKIDKKFVSIDGQTKRKKCNILHLAPLEQQIKIKKGATHADIVKELKSLNIDVTEKKSKPKKERPKKKTKVKPKTKAKAKVKTPILKKEVKKKSKPVKKGIKKNDTK